MRWSTPAVVIGSLLIAAADARAQRVDIEEIKQGAQEAASEFAELRTLLRSPDENLRLAAFDAMVDHGHPSLFELATATALGDASDVVRARALWEVLSQRATFTVLFDPEGSVANENIASELDELFHGRENYDVAATFADRKCLSLYQTNRCQAAYSLSLSGVVASLTYGDLVGQLVLDGDGVLRGTLRHDDVSGAFPAEIRLR